MASKKTDTDNLSQYIRKLEEVEKARHKRILMYVAFGAFFLFMGFGTYHLITESTANYNYEDDFEAYIPTSEAITVNANTLANSHAPNNGNGTTQNWEDDNYNMLEDWPKAERDKKASSTRNRTGKNGTLRGGNPTAYSNSSTRDGSEVPDRELTNSTGQTSIPSRLISPSASSGSPNVYDVADLMPTYPNGAGAMYRFIRANIQYPNKAIFEGIEGQVHVQFIVRPDGSLTNFKVVKSLGFGCDEEAVRIIRKMPNWQPGETRGQIVSVKKTVPVTFVLP